MFSRENTVFGNQKFAVSDLAEFKLIKIVDVACYRLNVLVLFI